MHFEVQPLVQDADNQDIALRSEHIKDYVMPILETIQVWYDFIILF